MNTDVEYYSNQFNNFGISRGARIDYGSDRLVITCGAPQGVLHSI